MKKILLTLSLAVSALGFGQYSQDGYGYGNSDGWYDTYDEGYFPDDYYYNYPNDYYSDDYYQSMYNDYRNSVVSINWNRFFVEARLTPYQINLIIDLNRQFPSFSVWNSYYRANPVRWYYDRFYALREILGSQIFVIFQNDFYNGYSPVVYYTNYWRDYYRPRFVCRPRYRNVNISLYRVNRYDLHRDRGNRFGWNQANPHNPGISGNNGRVGASNRNINTGRNSGIIQNRPFSSTRNDGFRNGSTSSVENSRRELPNSIRTERSDNGNMRVQGGFRNGASSEMRNRSERISQPKSSDKRDSGSSRTSSRNTGMRFTSR